MHVASAGSGLPKLELLTCAVGSTVAQPPGLLQGSGGLMCGRSPVWSGQSPASSVL